jgi:hypothetical protein
MVYQECNTVAEVFHEVFDLVKRDRSHIETDEETDKVAYYFRAENKNYAQKGSSCPPSMPAAPSLFRDDKYIQNEHFIFNEAIRCYPQEFSASETTFERLTRMAHFELPTRLLDVSPRLATAIGMASLPSPSDDEKEFFTWNGFIRVFRVNKEILFASSESAEKPGVTKAVLYELNAQNGFSCEVDAAVLLQLKLNHTKVRFEFDSKRKQIVSIIVL